MQSRKNSMIRFADSLFLSRNFLLILATTILLSTSSILCNALVYHYHTMNYFPPFVGQIGIIILFLYIGFLLQFGSERTPTLILQELLFFFIILACIAYATNATQLTPFKPIDQHLIVIDRLMKINTPSILSWVGSYSTLKHTLIIIYNSLSYQMCYIPLFVILMRKIELMREYCFLLIVSVLIGFTFYYFFPSQAPASVLDSPFFLEEQRATGLKFTSIHLGQPAKNIDGGLIAFPSFHVIWAWFCLYLLRPWPIAFCILLPINIILALSCVTLGWHYGVDLLGSALVILLSHACLNWSLNKPKSNTI